MVTVPSLLASTSEKGGKLSLFHCASAMPVPSSRAKLLVAIKDFFMSSLLNRVQRFVMGGNADHGKPVLAIRVPETASARMGVLSR
jgi:hypothetical protein